MMIHTWLIHLPSCTRCQGQTENNPHPSRQLQPSDSSEAVQGNVHEEPHNRA